MDFLLPCSLQCTPNKKFHKKRRRPSTSSTPVSHRYRLFLSFFFFLLSLSDNGGKKFSAARLYAVHIFAHCKTKQYTRLNIDSQILNGVWWNLAGAGDWGDCASLFLRLWHMSCWAGGAPLSISPSPPPPPPPPPPSRFISQRGRGTCSLSMRSTASLFLSSHCITAVFQHTNNRDCGGSSPLQRCCQPPRCDYMSGNTLTMATITLPFPTSQCQPLLINPWGPRSCRGTCVYMCH